MDKRQTYETAFKLHRAAAEYKQKAGIITNSDLFVTDTEFDDICKTFNSIIGKERYTGIESEVLFTVVEEIKIYTLKAFYKD